MATSTTYPSQKAVICYGPDSFHALFVQPGTSVSTGQATVEEFDTAAEAVDRLIAVRPTALAKAPAEYLATLVPNDGIPEWTAEGSYAIHTLVQHDGRTWLHTSDQQGEPDDIYDINAGTGDWVPVDIGA